jgi:hypothetical protein
MKRVGYALLFCCTLGGCGQFGHQADKKQSLILKGLLSSTDRLLILRYFPEEKIVPQIPNPEYSPGSLTFGPIIVNEPEKETERTKGLGIAIEETVKRSEYHQPTEMKSILDLNEARDLQSALKYIISTEEAWKKAPPTVRTQIYFSAQDSFSVTLHSNKTRDVIVFSSGKIGSADVDFLPESLSEIQAKLTKTINILDTN